MTRRYPVRGQCVQERRRNKTKRLRRLDNIFSRCSRNSGGELNKKVLIVISDDLVRSLVPGVVIRGLDDSSSAAAGSRPPRFLHRRRDG
ncbi:unnamed protein product [Lota lota]